MIVDLVPVVREAVGVSSSYDAVTIPAGISRAIRFMLRTWSFPAALVTANFPLADGAAELVLPTNGVGKIRAVRLRDSSDPVLYKRLRRTLVGELPHSQGPLYYWQEGNTLKLDTPISGAGYSADVWYNNTDVAINESWITEDFEDTVYTLSVLRLAIELRKPEVAGTFQAIWQEHVPTLAQYLNEVEYNDLDVRMRPEVNVQNPNERYGV